MLKTLRIRNLAIVEDVTVEFGDGLNLLTGETGAGKSILVGAVGLAAGDRADSGVVRSGAERAVVEALFELSGGDEAAARLTERGIEPEDGQLLVRREVAATGSGRVLLNGSPATVGLLREVGRELVEIHGQHEHQTLLSPERHLELLDEFGRHDEPRKRVATAHAAVVSARQRLEALHERQQRRRQREQELRELTAEIEAIAPREGELERLARERKVLQHAGAIAENVERALTLLYDGDSTAGALAAGAAASLAALDGLDPALDELRRRVDSARLELDDIGAALRDYRQQTDFDSGRLDALESRRAALERLLLRHGPDERAALERCEAARRELAELADLRGDLDRAGETLQGEIRRYAAACRRLTARREKAAARLATAVRRELGELALREALLEVALSPARGETLEVDGQAFPLHPGGAERAELLLAANPGEPPRPLNRVASGGELSRVMLALHGLFDHAAGRRVLIFDEVDAGVGGTVADAVGSRLSRLSGRDQVLCLTHLAQVAAYADRHYHVRKEVRRGRTFATIVELTGDRQVDELARMLGGREITHTSRRHAAELLEAKVARAAPSAPRRRA